MGVSPPSDYVWKSGSLI